MPILVPLALQEKLSTENVVKALLAAVEEAGSDGLPSANLRRLCRVGFTAERIQRIENRLVREGIIVAKSDRLYLAPLASIRSFVDRTKWMDSRVVAIAPEEPKPIIVAPGSDT